MVIIHEWTEFNQTSLHQVQIAQFSFQYLEHKLFLHLIHFNCLHFILDLEFNFNKILLIFLLIIFLIIDQFIIKDFQIHFLKPLIYSTFIHESRKYLIVLHLDNNDLIIFEYLEEYFFINLLQIEVPLLLNQQYFTFDY